MFSEEINQKIAALFEGDNNGYSVTVQISHDLIGFHFKVHIGGWIGDICTSGTGQSRISLDDALTKAISSRQQIGHKRSSLTKTNDRDTF